MYGCEIPLSPGLGAVCNDLRVEHSLQMWPGASLQVGGNLHSIGRIFMDGNLLQVAGDLTIGYWYSGSWLQCTTFPIAQIRVGGNCLFETGTSVLLSVGQLIFYNPSGGGTQTFTVDAIGTRFNDIVVNNMGRTLDYNSMIVQFPPVTIAGSLTVAAGAVLNLTSPQMINIDGNLIVDPAGVFRATLGTIYLTGNPGPQSVNVANPMSFFNDLTVNTNTGLVTNLLSNITVRGNFSIDNGALAANNHILSIQGNWLNNVGTGAFQKGMSRVIFGGSGNQHIVVTSPAGAIQEDFHILELANTPGNLILNTPGQQVQCDIYDHTAGTLVVSDGVFTALDLADMSLTGGFTCNAPGMMNLTDFSANADLSGNLTIHGGTINVSIGNPVPGSVSTWGIQPGSVTIDSGQLCFINTGVNVIPGGALFSTNITGGTISSAGDFTVFRPEFSPSGGIVTLNGSHPAQIAATGGGYFHNVRSAVSTLTTLANVQVNGNIIVDGSSSFNVGNNLHIAGQLSIAGTLSVNSPAILTLLSAEVTGSLSINSGAEMQTGTEIDIQAGGSFTSAGVSGNPAKLKGYSGAYWKMQVSGTIYADKTEFLHLHANGIWVNPTGTVDVAGAFSDCLFTQGQSGDCTFLTLNNSQDLTLNGINFTSGGGESYNLAKTVNTGSVTVSSSSGDFAGPLYENDPHTRIAWVGYDPNLIVETFTVSDPVPYVADQISYHVVIKNDSANPVQSTFRIHLFKNQASAPGWSDTGDYYHECPTLSPNATHSFDFTQLYSMTDESWISWLLIDPESAITETSETDNLDSEAVTWQALPEVDPVSLATTGSNSARVSWSYPIWVTRYRIYECDDPYGTFWYHGQTTASFFDITLSGDRLFYQVKAERDDPFPSK